MIPKLQPVTASSESSLLLSRLRHFCHPNNPVSESQKRYAVYRNQSSEKALPERFFFLPFRLC
jgi:hypothetical protein